MEPRVRPREMDSSHLVLSYFSLERRHPMEDRIAAAAAAGFDGIGLYIGEYRRLVDEGRAGAWLDELLDRHSMCIAEIEVVQGWAGPADAIEACRAMEDAAWELADRFGCRSLQAIGPVGGTLTEAGHAFGALCDRAADHGLLVSLEFLPFTNVATASDALHVVEVADRPNGGVCVDIWHHRRGTDDRSLIDAIPAEKITGVQISDGTRLPARPDYLQDCLRNRVAPGDGEFDVAEFVGYLRGRAVDVPWGMEVCSEPAWGRPAATHVERIAESMRAVLAALK